MSPPINSIKKDTRGKKKVAKILKVLITKKLNTQGVGLVN